MFLNLIKLEKAAGQTILDSLLRHLRKLGLNRNYLQEHLICFAGDGASIVARRVSGITTKLQEIYFKFGFLALFHL